MIRRIGVLLALLFVSLSIAVGLPSLAQTSPSAPRSPQAAPSPRSPQAAPRTQGQISEVDRQFMLDANRNAMAAIALGRLALEKSTGSEVKQFAQAEIDEQVQVMQNLTRLAPTLGVNLPSAPTPKDQEVLTQMGQLSGQRFDEAFMNEVGINAHLENAAIYQREASLGQNQNLVALATNGLSLIDQHYTIASRITGYEIAQVPPRIGISTPDGTQSNDGLSTPNNAPVR